MSTPNDQAAARILKAIEEKKLLSPENFKTLASKFSAGRMTASDWKVFVKADLLKPKSDANPQA